MVKEESFMFPRLLYIESTNFCNSHCYMCPARLGHREKGFMTLELYKKIVDDVHFNRIEFPSRFPKNFVIYVQGQGSPLLSKDLFEMIKYTKKKNIRIGFSTNAQELNKTNAEKILKAGIDVLELSVYALNREKYLHIHGVDRMETAFKNILRFLYLSEKYTTTTKANILISERTLSEVGFLNYLYRALPLISVNNMLIRDFHNSFGQIGLFDELDFLKRFKGLFDIPEVQVAFKGYTPRWVPNNSFWMCSLACMMIFWDGDVNPCPADYEKRYIVGNAGLDDIFKIWNNNRYKRFRRAVIDNDFKGIGFDFCDKCSYTNSARGHVVSIQVLNRKMDYGFIIDNFPPGEEDKWLDRLELLRNEFSG